VISGCGELAKDVLCRGSEQGQEGSSAFHRKIPKILERY
jgi:hypothetical protein